MKNLTVIFLAIALSAVACAPDDDIPEVEGLRGMLPSEPITVAEVNAGRGHDGRDGVRPEDGIDGDPQTQLERLRAYEAEEGAQTQRGEVSRVVSAVSSCTRTTGYQNGVARSICVTTVDGKQVEINTANAFLAMRAAAARAGVSIYIVSGFRTMEHQRYLYQLYLSGRGNLAAPPGYSNHQNGLALDLNTADRGVYSWLVRNAGTYGFRATVPSEDWHWEHNGSPAAGASAGVGTERCYSQSYNRWMEAGTCLQSRIDNAWYQCADGAWREGRGTRGPCTHTYARGDATQPTMSPSQRQCYSATLARNVPYGACVQGSSDRRWYQCNLSGWLASDAMRGPAGNCVSSTPVTNPSAPPPPTNHTCFSTTLGREVRYGTCVQSRADRQWYQCNFSGWLGANNTRGPAGNCVESRPLN
jgi:hypothetical protein